jgi:hypothetical protein
MQALMFRKWLQIAIRNNAQKSRSLRRKTSDQIELLKTNAFVLRYRQMK